MLLTVMQIFRSVVDEPATWLYRPELARRRTTSRSPPVDVRLNRAAAPGGLSSSTGEEIFDGRPFIMTVPRRRFALSLCANVERPDTLNIVRGA